MTPEEADVMQDLIYARGDEHPRVEEILVAAQRLLAQHADDQKPTDMAWLVDAFEGHGGYAGHGAGDDRNWDFWTDGEAEVGVCCRNGAVAIHIWTHWIPGTTRGDVRRLPPGMLVPKKKGEVA